MRLNILQKKRYIFLFILSIIICTPLMALTSNTAKPSENTSENILLPLTAAWPPSANWKHYSGKKENMGYILDNCSGNMAHTTITAMSVSNEWRRMKKIEKILLAKGFSYDKNFEADGPASAIWGYKKKSNERHVVLFSYKMTGPTKDKPNTPPQYDCPCHVELEVFTGICEGPKERK